METQDKIKQFSDILCQESSKLPDRYRAIFELKTIGTDEAAEALIKSFPHQGDSELLKHEIAYALGQMRKEKNASFLLEVMNNPKEHPIVRHEAAEGLSYLNDKKYADEFRKHVDSEYDELRDTCRIALRRLEDQDAKNYNGLEKYGYTLEPAPGYKRADALRVLEEKFGKLENPTNDELAQKAFEYIVSEDTHIYDKYKALYFLRNEESEKAIEGLGALLDPKYRKVTGALLRHEVCFALGMLAEKASILKERLQKTIEDKTENDIVRHEAISAYSSACNDHDFLEKFRNDEARVVRESIIVAIDMIHYWES